ncbi:MAG: flavodoxin family protein [Deltaproteobacteria bacterium]|nr:MAG: flavodoxin family protein [Deltaproteobacteria bacterium]
MKVTTILGSPRKKGNTATVLGWFEQEAKGQGHDIYKINIVESDVKGCLGCRSCEKVTDYPGCVQKDDAMAIFDRMIEADAVVYASPLFCWGFTSQIKALIDRHFCLVKNYSTPEHKSFLEGKATALLVTCTGPVKNNADIIQVLFDRLSRFVKCNVIGKYVVPFCTTPDAMGSEAKEIIKRMTKDILSDRNEFSNQGWPVYNPK